MRPRPFNGLRHCSTPSLPFLLSQFVTTLAKFHSRVRLIVGAIKPEPTPQALQGTALALRIRDITAGQLLITFHKNVLKDRYSPWISPSMRRPVRVKSVFLLLW